MKIGPMSMDKFVYFNLIVECKCSSLDSLLKLLLNG